MFDISFTELLVVGVIALLVLGPERLPKVARTVGHLFGRAQRYVSEVKTDIEREINLEEVNSIKNQVKDAAKSVQDSVNATTKQLTDPLEEARRAINEFSTETEKSVDDAIKGVSSSVDSSATKKDDTAPAEAQASLPLTKDHPYGDDTPSTTEATVKPASDEASNISPKSTT
ncbi:MAG TPA: Sec-independent protein translocase protein TatB [Paenalcaligenes sp.]|nr:Sec-independent protein translocase protein TatB [Paenalcaligenes sp.]